MKIETTIADMNGSKYVRIPANMAQYFKIGEKKKCFIEDDGKNIAVITFPVW